MSQSKQMKFGRRWIQKLTGKALTDVGYNVTLDSTLRFNTEINNRSSDQQFSVLQKKFERLDMQERFEYGNSCSRTDEPFLEHSEHQFTQTIEELGTFKETNRILQGKQNENLHQGTSWVQHVTERKQKRHCTDERSLFRESDPEGDLQVYENFFYGVKHWNFFCVDDDIGEIIMSLKMEILHGEEYIRLLIRCSLRSVHAVLSVSSMGVPGHCSDPYSWIGTLTQLLQLTRPFQLITHHTVGTELIKLDRVFVKTVFKIGVLYVKNGQKTEEDIFSNTSSSTAYETFLDMLGDHVTLKGFIGYSGGLDTSNDVNGTQSICTTYRNNSIMFHVSTLMPTTNMDLKHLGKKRHIGNDVLCIVFTDGKETTFSPLWIRSQFIYAYLLIQIIDPSSARLRFKVSVLCRNEVPWFGPCLSEDDTFEEGDEFREWLLRKIINGDRACYKAPKFASMQQRTRRQIMNDILEKELACHNEKTIHRRWTMPLSQSDHRDSIESIFSDVPITCLEDDNPKLKYFYNVHNEELSYGDVAFLAGKTYKRRIYGVSSVMCSKSRVFRDMLTDGAIRETHSFQNKHATERSLVKITLKRMRAQGTVQSRSRKGKFAIETPTEHSPNVDDHVKTTSIKIAGHTYEIPVDCKGKAREFIMDEFEADIFSAVIDYIHNDKCTITHETLPGLLCAATYYELLDLRMSCYNIQDDIINVKTVCPMLNIVEEYIYFKDGKELQQKLLRFFVSNCMEIIADNHIASLSRSRMILVLCQDWKADIERKVRATISWAKSKDLQKWKILAKSALSSAQISEDMLHDFVPELNTI